MAQSQMMAAGKNEVRTILLHRRTDWVTVFTDDVICCKTRKENPDICECLE